MKTLYGLIGYPVKHSMSALMHNAAFKHMGIDAEYRLFEVEPGRLKAFFNDFKARGISGINITIPHKTASMLYCDDLSTEAKLIEAVNTVALKGDRLVGYNTDGIGFIRSLRKDLGFDPKGKTAFVIGAGGAARAVCFSLADQGASRIVLTDIDAGRAAGLARDVEKKTGVETLALESKKSGLKELVLNSDLVVNATPCGMKKGDKELLPPDVLRGNFSVFDLIYNPKETPLIKHARKMNLAAVNGLGMLIFQGAAAFELWTQKPAPIDVMRKAVGC